MKNVMVLSVHPDDETFGCGGTLLRHKTRGDKLSWCIVTTMEGSPDYDRQEISRRNKEIKAVASAYEFKNIFELGFSTTQLDLVERSKIVQKIAKVFQAAKPEVLYLPYFGDVHSDHRIAFEAAYSCTKWFRFPYLKEIYMMEILSETEFSVPGLYPVFQPNVFVDISGHIKQKMRILNKYHGQLLRHPFPRSIKHAQALAIRRGAMAGCNFAEGFMLVKRIVK